VDKIKFEISIYSFQIDFNGHVSNIVYSQWLEIGRTKLLEAIAMPVHKIAEAGFVPVLIRTEITFKSPLLLGDIVHIELWLSELRHASAVMSFNIFKIDHGKNTLVATANQKGIFADRYTMKPYRLKPEQKAKFARYLHPNSPNSVKKELKI
jgi:YbgC/YbaW family acyl-CoA thioester hydrolase